MIEQSVRNTGCVPDLGSEGVFLRPLETQRGDDWSEGLAPFQRMHAHHTLASARRYAHFRPFKHLVPTDDLDFVLSSSYDHSLELFPDTVDVYLQKETIGKDTWRRLRNTADPKARLEARALVPLFGGVSDSEKKLPYRYNKAHPVIISGIVEKEHPSHVKLMNSSHHSPQTNAGYSRQDSDGNVYQY